MSDTNPLKLRELKLEDLRQENKRLRDARAAATSQLGPLPLSAAIVAGLVSGFASGGKAFAHYWLAVAALCVFGAMVLVSTLSSAFAPYRKLRARVEESRDKPAVAEENVEAWYDAMIAIEKEVHDGVSGRRGDRPWHAKNLEDAYDKEWKGLFATRALFVAVIVLLVLAHGIG